MPKFLRRSAAEALRWRSSAEWVEYFLDNRERPRPIPWNEGVVLTAAERAAVMRSIQTFQLGESGEGKHFLRVAERYANRRDDYDYLVALKMFLAEEHRHAGELGRALDLAGEPRLHQEWTDHIFRWLRHRAGLELMIVVLLTGEVMAQVYYAALRQATRSQVLVRLCEQILVDESAHVRFQSERLALLRRNCWWPGLVLRAICERILFDAACCVVWRGHRGVFRAAHYSFCRFWRRAHTAFRNSCRLRDPRRYVEAGVATQPAGVPSTATVNAFPASTRGVYS
jgi:hypothetical protein